jgi:hypothetical protein
MTADYRLIEESRVKAGGRSTCYLNFSATKVGTALSTTLLCRQNTVQLTPGPGGLPPPPPPPSARLIRPAADTQCAQYNQSDTRKGHQPYTSEWMMAVSYWDAKVSMIHLNAEGRLLTADGRPCSPQSVLMQPEAKYVDETCPTREEHWKFRQRWGGLYKLK